MADKKLTRRSVLAGLAAAPVLPVVVSVLPDSVAGREFTNAFLKDIQIQEFGYGFKILWREGPMKYGIADSTLSFTVSDWWRAYGNK